MPKVSIKILNTKYRKSFGFTLIELLVAFAIISTIIGIAYTSYTNAQEKARDRARKENLNQIKTALVAYRNDFGHYPPDPDGNPLDFYSTAGGDWIPGLVPDYLQEIPKDPKQAGLINVIKSLAKFFPFNLKSVSFPNIAGSQSSTFTSYTTDGNLQYDSPTNPPDTGSCTANRTEQKFWLGMSNDETPTYRSSRGYLAFNTSSIPDNATITSASLKLTVYFDGTKNDFEIRARNFDWGSSLEDDCRDWGGNPPAAPLAGTFNTAGLPQIRESFTIPLSNFSGINMAGSSYFMLSSDKEEANDATIEPFQFLEAYSADSTEASYRPQLVVDYSYPDPTPSPFITETANISATRSDNMEYRQIIFYPPEYNNCRVTSSQSQLVGQYPQTFAYTLYEVYRTYQTFDTSSIPDNATITSASLQLNGISDHSENDFTMNVRYYTLTTPPLCIDSAWGGNPPIATIAGTFNTVNFVIGTNTIPLSNLSGINKTGQTKLMLASANEENNIRPTASELIGISGGSSPQLIVNYTAPAPTPSPTPTPSATPSETVSPSPTPPPPPVEPGAVYGYSVSVDRNYFILWTELENENDNDIWNKPQAQCRQSPPGGTTLNYCVEAPE